MQREHKALASLDSPFIVRVHDFFIHEEVPFLVMDLLDGRPLDEWLRSKPDLLSILETFRKLALGLKAMHERGAMT